MIVFIQLLLWMLRLVADLAPLLAVAIVIFVLVRLTDDVSRRLRRRRELALERHHAERRIQELKNEAITKLLDVEHEHPATTASEVSDRHVAAMSAAVSIEESATLIVDGLLREK